MIYNITIVVLTEVQKKKKKVESYSFLSSSINPLCNYQNKYNTVL